MTQRIVIVGIGGFGREVADLVKEINAVSPSDQQWNLLGFLDDAPSEENVARAARQGNSYLGPVRPEVVAGQPYFVIAINNPIIRKELAERLEDAGWIPATLIHPTVHIGSDCSIGPGTILCSGTQITTNVILGQHVQVNSSATIGHDTRLRDFVSVNPLAAISGDVVVGEGSSIGGGAFILQGLNLSDWSVIGASACVVKSTTCPSTFVGVPAKALEKCHPRV